jgi:serine/threonine-protein kinase
VDFRSDIFSLGVVIYEMVTGSSPYTAREVGELMQQISSSAAPPPSAGNPALPAMLDLIVARALEKDPGARYQSSAELAADIRACLAESATRPRGEMQAAAGAPAPLDLDLGGGTTVKIEPAVKTQVAGEAARTLKLGEAGPSSVAGDIALSVSRRFDSAAALERLGHESPENRAVGTARLPRLAARLWRDPDLRVVAIATLAALAAAVMIAVF